MLPTPKSLSGTSIPEMNLPWVESPFFRELLPGKCRSRQEREDAAFYHENGYLVFRGAVTAELADRVRMETRDLFRPGVREGPRCANRGYPRPPGIPSNPYSERMHRLARLLRREGAISKEEYDFLTEYYRLSIGKE